MKMVLIWVVVCLAVCATGVAEEAPNVLVNGQFETDLSGWTTEGTVALSATAPLEGKNSLQLGPGAAAVHQEYRIGGSRIVWFGAHLKADASVTGYVRAQCYAADGKRVLDLRQSFDPEKAKAKEGTETGLYFKTQAKTIKLVVSIEKEAGKGTLCVDDAKLIDYDRDRKPTLAPMCNLQEYLQPIWKGNTVYNETVLLVSENGKPAQGTLLYTPSRILSVRDYSLKQIFREEIDYILEGKVLTCTKDSRLPTVKDSSLPQADRMDFPWYDIAGKHVVVTYTHNDRWGGRFSVVGQDIYRTRCSR